MPRPLDALSALDHVVDAKAGGAPREGQQQMAAAIESALAEGDVLLVEAGTGTGKSFAYLIPAVLHAGADPERRVVIATATKALQEQLVEHDLPFLSDVLAKRGVRFSFALLKGRSNYLCQARVRDELAALPPGAPLTDDFGAPIATAAQVEALTDWSQNTTTGDWSEHPVPDKLRLRLSATSDDCPGRAGCPMSEGCHYFAARDRAAQADLVVANTALYGAHLASGGRVLPAHQVVVIDEAHTLEAVMTDAFGVTLSASRLRVLASRARRAIVGIDTVTRRLRAQADDLENALSMYAGDRINITTGEWPAIFDRIASLAEEVSTEAASAQSASAGKAGAAGAESSVKLAMVATMAANLAESIDTLKRQNADSVTWVELDGHSPKLRHAPAEVGPLLASRLFADMTVVATSATLTTNRSFAPIAHTWGLPADTGGLLVSSPFTYPRQGILYVASHLPEPNSVRFSDAMHDELAQLATAAGGRTLALFTSRKAMRLAAEHLEQVTRLRVLTQDDGPREQVLGQFTSAPGQVLCATSSYWTGVDIPGSALTLVTIDKIPFPRRNDPLVDARRGAASRRGRNAFAAVDIPEASRELAQGVGRLIRTTTDRGVVAVFDSRLTAKSYGAQLLGSLPDFYRARDLPSTLASLRRLVADQR